jgi:hypothetical protein
MSLTAIPIYQNIYYLRWKSDGQEKFVAAEICTLIEGQDKGEGK